MIDGSKRWVKSENVKPYSRFASAPVAVTISVISDSEKLSSLRGASKSALRWISFGRENSNISAALLFTAGSSDPSLFVHITTAAGSSAFAMRSIPRMKAFTPARSSWCICAASLD